MARSLADRIRAIRSRYDKLRAKAEKKKGRLSESEKLRYARLERWAVAAELAKRGDAAQRRLAKTTLRYKTLAKKAGKGSEERFDALERAAVLRAAGKIDGPSIVYVGEDMDDFTTEKRVRLIGVSGPVHESEILALEDTGGSDTEIEFEGIELVTKYSDYDSAKSAARAILSNLPTGGIRWYVQY